MRARRLMTTYFDAKTWTYCRQVSLFSASIAFMNFSFFFSIWLIMFYESVW